MESGLRLYSDKQPHTFIAKDQLIEFLESEFHLFSANQIREYANLFSNRAVDTVDIVLLNNSVYWLVRFNSMDYTLFYSDGTPLTQADFEDINSYFVQKDFYNFIDLIAEKEHLERILSIKGFILSCAFMQIGDSVDKMNEYLSKRNFDFTFEDVIKLLPDTQFVSDSFPFKLEDYPSKMELLNYLYSLHFISTVLTAPLYQSLFDEDLLDDILKIQGDFSLSCEERKNAIFLLKVSPAAVFNVINPDKFLVNASKNIRLSNGPYQSKAHQQLVTKFFNLLINGMIFNMNSQVYWKIVKSLGVEKYTFLQQLTINEKLDNEIKIITAPTVLFANISNIPTNDVVPVVMFD